MMFSVQGLMGLKSTAITSGAQADTYGSKQIEPLLQGEVSDRKNFFNLLVRADEHGKNSNQSGIRQPESPTREQHPQKDLLDFLRSELIPDDSDHALEILNEVNMHQLSETVINIHCCADSSELKQMVLGLMEESRPSGKESYIEPLLLQDFNFVLENGELPANAMEWVGHSKGVNDLPVEMSGQQFPSLLKQLFATLENSKGQSTPEVNSDVARMANLLKSQTEQVHVPVTDNRQEVPGFKDQMPLDLENGRIPVRPEVSTLVASMVKTHEGRTGINPQVEETREEINVRHILHSRAGESQSTPDADTEILDAELKVFPPRDENKLNVEQNAKNISVKIPDTNLHVPRDNGQTVSNHVFQNQTATNFPNNTNSLNYQVRQSSMLVDQDFQIQENRIVSQVFACLNKGSRQGSGHWMINLYPPELGKVKVRIFSGKGSLNIHLQSQTHQVAGVLEKHLSALQHSLEDQGLVLSDLQVSVESGNQEGSQFEEQGFRFADQETPITQLTKKDQDSHISGRNPEWSGSPWGLSLIV